SARRSDRGATGHEVSGAGGARQPGGLRADGRRIRPAPLRYAASGSLQPSTTGQVLASAEGFRATGQGRRGASTAERAGDQVDSAACIKATKTVAKGYTTSTQSTR